MLETGVLLLFLVPGLAAYASLYGLFHSGRAIAPEPPAANTVEAAIVIVGASVTIHGVCAAAFAFNGWICGDGCPLRLPAPWLDPYRSALAAVKGEGIGGTALSIALAGVMLQGLGSYVVVRWRLHRLARRDRLPAWIYGWAVDLANAVDNDDTAILAYVLTTTDMGGGAIGYGGLVHDLALRSDGSIVRVTLSDCERYLFDLTSSADLPSLSDALSHFAFMAIDGTNIRNIAFEVVDLSVPLPPAQSLAGGSGSFAGAASAAG